MSPGVKLHLGCGDRYIPGFVHVDAVARPHVNILGHVESLPMADATVSMIYASHILEHFDRKKHLEVLTEWFRVLEPGGLLRLSVPDFAACAAEYYESGIVDGLTGLVGLVVGGQRDEYDYHKMIFDQQSLSQALLCVGFAQVRSWDWRQTEHSHIDDYSQAYLPHLGKEAGRHMSLNLEATK